MGSEAGQDNAKSSTDIDQLRARDEAIRDQYQFTQQSPNFIDDFSGGDRSTIGGSLPTISVQPTLTAQELASVPANTKNMMAGQDDFSDFNFAGSQAAQDFGLSVTFDEETGEYVEDVSAFGFEGDQATKRYSPEEFQKKMGGGSEAAVEEAVQETVQESEQQGGQPTSLLEPITETVSQQQPIPRG